MRGFFLLKISGYLRAPVSCTSFFSGIMYKIIMYKFIMYKIIMYKKRGATETAPPFHPVIFSLVFYIGYIPNFGVPTHSTRFTLPVLLRCRAKVLNIKPGVMKVGYC